MIAYVTLNKNETSKIILNNVKVVKPTDRELIANVNINANYNEKKKNKISKKFIQDMFRSDNDL